MSMTIDVARRIVEACKQRARELRSPVSIAIVDAGGHLVLFERMMSPYGWATGDISIAKATTAVMFNQSTDSVAQWGSGIPGFASSMATMTEGRFIMAAGGWPIRSGGATIGGIGVSGGNAPGRDDEIARVGLSAAEAISPPIPAQPMPQPQPQPAMSSPSQAPYSHPLPPMQPALSYPVSGQPPQSASTPSWQTPQASREEPVQQQDNSEPPSGTSYLPSQSDSDPYAGNDAGYQPYSDNRSGGQS